MLLKKIVNGAGIKFYIVKGADIDRYLRDINSVYWVLKSIKLLMLYTFELSTKNNRLLYLSAILLFLIIWEDIISGFLSKISLSSYSKVMSTYSVHSNFESS